MPDQYSTIATPYANIQFLPASSLELPCVAAILGPTDNVRCLDLACGLGRWTKYLLEHGAAHVVGIDISPATLPAELRDRATFLVADCTQPLALEELKEPFDLALGAWLLNYAATAAEQLGMWRNIYSSLLPGGRFVGVAPNVHLDLAMHPVQARYGYSVEALEAVEDGWKCRLTAHTEPEEVSFEMWHLRREVYERCAEEAGMVGLEWRGYVLPDEQMEEGNEEGGEGYWDAFVMRSSFEVCTAWRPA